MLKETVERIERAIERIDATDSRNKAELIRLLAALKSEVSQLSKTNQEQARSIAGFAELAAHEATRKEKSPRLLKNALKGLSLSVEGFETSHTKLTQIINGVCLALARIGI